MLAYNWRYVVIPVILVTELVICRYASSVCFFGNYGPTASSTLCLDMVVPARLVFCLFAFYRVYQIHGHSGFMATFSFCQTFLFYFQIWKACLKQRLKLALTVSVLRGLLVPVHGTVCGQAQLQVTPSPQHGYQQSSPLQISHPLQSLSRKPLHHKGCQLRVCCPLSFWRHWSQRLQMRFLVVSQQFFMPSPLLLDPLS